MKNINSWSCHLEGLIPYFNNLKVKENVSSFEFHDTKLPLIIISFFDLRGDLGQPKVHLNPILHMIMTFVDNFN
jgi:hypothetical protein